MQPDLIDTLLFTAFPPPDPSWEYVEALQRLQGQVRGVGDYLLQPLDLDTPERLMHLLARMAEAHHDLADWVDAQAVASRKRAMASLPSVQPLSLTEANPPALTLLLKDLSITEICDVEENYDNAW